MGDERSTIAFLQLRTDVLDKLTRRSQDRYVAIQEEIRGQDENAQIAGRQTLAAVAAIVVCRIEQLESQAEQSNWRNLPMYSKMEYIALSDYNDRIHADAQWPTFAANS